jgi:hypothetical protein
MYVPISKPGSLISPFGRQLVIDVSVLISGLFWQHAIFMLSYEQGCISPSAFIK